MKVRLGRVAIFAGLLVFGLVVGGTIGIASFCREDAFNAQNWTVYGLCEGTNDPREVFLGNGLIIGILLLLVIYLIRHVVKRGSGKRGADMPTHWTDNQ